MTTMTSEPLTREQLLAKSERRFDSVEVEGYGTVRVQSLNDLEQSEVQAVLVGSEKASDEAKGRRFFKSRRMVAMKAMIDKDGERLFGDEDMPLVESLDPKVVVAVYEKHLEMAGKSVSDEVKQQKKD